MALYKYAYGSATDSGTVSYHFVIYICEPDTVAASGAPTSRYLLQFAVLNSLPRIDGAFVQKQYLAGSTTTNFVATSHIYYSTTFAARI